MLGADRSLTITALFDSLFAPRTWFAWMLRE